MRHPADAAVGVVSATVENVASAPGAKNTARRDASSTAVFGGLAHRGIEAGDACATLGAEGDADGGRREVQRPAQRFRAHASPSHHHRHVALLVHSVSTSGSRTPAVPSIPRLTFLGRTSPSGAHFTLNGEAHVARAGETVTVLAGAWLETLVAIPGANSKRGTLELQEPQRKGMDDLHREPRSGQRARWPRPAQGARGGEPRSRRGGGQ